MATYSFTYQTITPESAANGDHEDHGFYDPRGWRYSMNDPDTAAHIQSDRDEYVHTVLHYGELADALRQARNLGICEDSGNWFSSVDPDCNYQTGEDTFYSFHVDGVTPATYARIARALNHQNIFGN